MHVHGDESLPRTKRKVFHDTLSVPRTLWLTTYWHPSTIRKGSSPFPEGLRGRLSALFPCRRWLPRGVREPAATSELALQARLLSPYQSAADFPEHLK